MQKSKNIGLIYCNDRVRVLYALSGLAVGVSLFTSVMIIKDAESICTSLNLSFPFSLLGLSVLLLVGNAFLFCLFWLDNRYVLKIEQTDQHYVLITTWRLFRTPKTVRYREEMLRSMKTKEKPDDLYWTSTATSSWILLRTSQGKRLVLDRSGSFTEGY